MTALNQLTNSNNGFNPRFGGEAGRTIEDIELAISELEVSIPDLVGRPVEPRVIVLGLRQ